MAEDWTAATMFHYGDFNKLIHTVQEPKFIVSYLLTFFCGLRAGELCGLTGSGRKPSCVPDVSEPARQARPFVHSGCRTPNVGGQPPIGPCSVVPSTAGANLPGSGDVVSWKQPSPAWFTKRSGTGIFFVKRSDYLRRRILLNLL